MEWLLVLVLARNGFAPGWETRSFAMPSEEACAREASRFTGELHAVCVPRQDLPADQCPPTRDAELLVVQAELRTERECRVRGDLDCNGVVTGVDFTLFQRAYAGAQP